MSGPYPVWLRRIDGHAAWANSAALRAVKGDLTAMRDPEGGQILRDAAGRPAGEAELMTQWAYGMFLLWDRVTGQCQRPDDRRELQALVSG